MLGLGALVLATGAGVAPVAPPESQGIRLQYVRGVGAESCPAERELRAAVVGRLGYDPFEIGARASVLARIASAQSGLVGNIELVDATGISRGNREMTTDGADCAEMARAMALSISIAIDPERAALGPATPVPAEPTEGPSPEPVADPVATPSSPARAEPSAAPTLETDAAPAEPPSAPRATTFSGSLAALSMAGVAPSMALGGALLVQGRRGRWALGVGGRLVRAPSTGVEHAANLQATLGAGELSGCVQHSVFEPCAVVLFGATWARAGRVTTPRTAVGAFGAAGVRLGLSAPLSRRFELFVQAEGVVVVSPIHPQVDAQDVWAAPSVAMGLGVGFRTHFW